MAKRTALRIYRVETSKQKGFAVKISDSRFVQNKDTSNVVFGYLSFGIVGDVVLESGDIPSEDATKYVGRRAVYKDTDTGWYYVLVEERKYFLKGSIPTRLIDDTDVPDVFEFLVNPNHITPVYRKLFTENRTRGGWEVQHWGEALTEIKVQGKSGGMHRDRTREIAPGEGEGVGQILGANEDITQSTAWKRLNQLKKMYDADHALVNRDTTTLLGMNYYDRFFIGYFTDFTGPEADAESPYIVNYSFTFKVQAETSVRTILGSTL